MLVISKKEQERLVDMREVLSHVETALVAFSNEETQTPIRTSLPFGNGENTALYMPSIAENLKSLGVKVVNVIPRNKSINKKIINGLVLLSDIETGEPQAMLEGSYITRMRTGALSGVATKYLSRENARTLGIIGTGEQAKGLIAAITVVREVEEVLLYNRTQSKAKEFASFIEEIYDIPTKVVSNANEVIVQSDIIATATNASEPVFSTNMKQGAHLNAVGSFRPNMQEIPSSSVISADRLVVESIDAALEETGDLMNPIKEGFSSESIVELGRIINGSQKGRSTDSEITVFKSVGLAVIDIVVGQYILEKARREGMGREVEL
ncbi:ornithine cyclodeaminase family protein [Virgibacillus sp. DJP39]|uniref:ornithine cyclodeaminase family protein n=1 Tax=Virgibacillus sp. DJP39 TaxID=3409790 RepID=UPI003BB66557